jgi:hypothetical protein
MSLVALIIGMFAVGSSIAAIQLMMVLERVSEELDA